MVHSTFAAVCWLVALVLMAVSAFGYDPVYGNPGRTLSLSRFAMALFILPFCVYAFQGHL